MIKSIKNTIENRIIEKKFEINFKSKGNDFPDIDFYVIRRDYRLVGLFSIFITTVANIKHAIDEGMVPVVDMQNYKNIYSNNSLFKANSWELFFKQPCGYTLKDIKKARSIYYSEDVCPYEMPSISMDFFNNKDGILDMWRSYVNKYIHIQENIIINANNRWDNLFAKDEKVLGIFIRGTDYVKMKPKDHPVQPSVEQVIVKINEINSEIKIDKYLLVTEDIEIVNSLKNEFGPKIVEANSNYLKYEDGYINDSISNSKLKYGGGFEYIESILLFNKCEYVIASRTSGTVAAALLPNNWKYSYFFDLGLY